MMAEMASKGKKKKGAATPPPPLPPPKGEEPTAEDVLAAWPRALERWGLAIQVDTPRLDPTSPALAYIDLTTREVVVNPVQVAELGAKDSLEAILAHELGHHLRYPHSLATQARLELLEREILPIRGYSLLNIFTDYLINCELAADPKMKHQLARVYLGGPATAASAAADPVFWFYLTCFEEAWGLDPCELTREAGGALEAQFPGVRAEAQVLAQEIPNLAPNLFTQFVYFASVLSRYQVFDPEKGLPGAGSESNPTKGDHSRPSAGDYADALGRSAQESDAIERAIREGWLEKEKVPDKAASERARAASLPGVLAGEPKKLAEAMALHYRRLAERYLFKPPKKISQGEPIIPSTLSPWEIGDAPKDIDWLASIGGGGVDFGVISPLKRDWIDDDPSTATPDWRIRLEIYLDVSGSMPDPKTQVNPMTLAAQVLAMSALRNGGQARALIYSTNNVKHWEWTRSEMEMSRFLMQYIGGGTDFPFAILEKSVKECGLNQPIRVVLTDSDFHYNLRAATTGKAPAAPAIVAAAAAKAPFVALLNNASAGDQWVNEIAAAGATTVPVADLASFPKTAAALGEALFGDAAKARAQRKPVKKESSWQGV